MSSLQHKIARRQQTAPQVRRDLVTFPAPVLGWNARDSLDDMDPRYAIILDNYFPDGSDVRLRDGTVDHATGLTGAVEYLHTLRLGASQKLVAFANNAAYDVSASGPVGPPLASSFVNNRWNGTNAGVNQGEVALFTNGADQAQSYNGTIWQPAGLVGPVKPNGITVANKRVWCYEEGTGEAWYLPPEAITGEMASFDIGSVVANGGALVGINTLSMDGGEGPDDYTVFVMASGAVVVYAGTNPADPVTWSLRGVWRAGEPIGNRCLVPFDKDLILITNNGFESILKFTTGGGVSGVPISDTIRNAVSDAGLQFKNNYGWNGIYNAGKRMLVFNVPILQGSSSQQFVMNTITGAWCRFSGVDALTHAIYLGERYIGVNGKVMKADTTKSDDGGPILGEIQTAWTYANVRGRDKHWKQFRTKVRADSQVNISLGLGVDFIDPVVKNPQSSNTPGGAIWDLAEWDTSFWDGGLENLSDWKGAHRKGFNASIGVKTQTAGANIQFLSSNILYEIATI